MQELSAPMPAETLTIPAPGNDDGYKNRYCLFLDIMGFEEKIKQSANDDDLRKMLDKALDEIINFWADDGHHSEMGATISTFSDSIAISFDGYGEGIERNSGVEDKATMIVCDAIRLALKLANLGLLVRGGLALGKLVHKNEKIFGPALVHAYQLEKTAIFPRIVTETSTVHHLADPRHRTAAFLATMIQHEPSGLAYINYVNIGGGHARFKYFSTEVVLGYIRSLYKIINDELTSTKKLDVSVRHKLDWMAHQYNQGKRDLLGAREGQFSETELEEIRGLPEISSEQGPGKQLFRLR